MCGLLVLQSQQQPQHQRLSPGQGAHMSARFKRHSFSASELFHNIGLMFEPAMSLGDCFDLGFGKKTWMIWRGK